MAQCLGIASQSLDVAARGCCDDALADDRVRFDVLPFLVVERARLVQDRVGDRELADVVERGGGLDRLEVGVVEPEVPRDRDCHRLTRAQMLGQLGLRSRSACTRTFLLCARALAATALLLHVHALIDEPQGILRIAWPPRQNHASRTRPRS